MRFLVFLLMIEQCMITNPLDMMANQIIERSRGNNKHGSCGMGIYNTIQRYKKHIDSYSLSWTYYMNMFKNMGITLSEQEEELFHPVKNPGLRDHYNEDLDFMMSHVHVVNNIQLLLNGYDTIVFENGQGLLLDQNNTEYYPHLTPSNTGIKNPARIIKAIRWTDEINIELSQKPECIDLMLHDDLKDDYSFRTNIQDIASLLSGILNIMQQANLTDKELAELEQLYNERYETNKSGLGTSNCITW